jgi:hypothetical protein
MSTDVLNYILPDEAWAQEFHMEVAGGGQPIYTLLQDKTIWLMKGAQGYPWDTLTFDEDYIYQSITDIDSPLVSGGSTSWTDPSMFKMFASASWPGANGGIAWMPRYLAGENVPVETSDSTYRSYSACGKFTTANLGGPIQTKVEGPYALSLVIPNFGTDIAPTTPCIVQSYIWGPNGETLEQNVYASGYGLVRWTTSNLVNGVYVLQQTSLFNTLTPGGAPQPNFPCGVPTI